MADEEDIARMRASKVSSNGVPRCIRATRSPFRLFISQFSSSRVDIVRGGLDKRIMHVAEPVRGRGKTLSWFYKFGEGTCPVSRLPLDL